MTSLRGTLTAAATVPLLLIGACARPGEAGSAPDALPESASAAPADADQPVLRMQSYGGFVPAELTVGGLPEVSVYADGRVISNGPVALIYPGPALPNVQVQRISPDQVRKLVADAPDAGVRDGVDFGRPNVADAPTTRVTVRDGYGEKSVDVEALQEGRADDPQLTAAQREARTKLSAYVGKVRDIPADEAAPRPAAYEPTALAVLARPWVGPGQDPKSPEVAWSGPALPGKTLSPGIEIGCVILTGAEMDKALTAAKTATAITPWAAGGKKYLINFRPLLPDESDCEAMKGPGSR